MQGPYYLINKNNRSSYKNIAHIGRGATQQGTVACHLNYTREDDLILGRKLCQTPFLPVTSNALVSEALGKQKGDLPGDQLLCQNKV